MSGLSKIDIDFAAVMEQAARLGEIADSMKELAEKNFDGALQNIAQNWKGENASLYLTKGDTLETNMKDTAKRLKSIAESIENRARYIKSKEDHAINVAIRRTY